ncbi:helix-turn-helix domain-containing protein [Streptomyces sp. NPDC010273]|uniref:helix-turn-helix domain-containing protein n=1 Tax=Streptomyces sp. NPDC010273 TaxID=3364829 RepID=UPI0036EC964D
MKNERPDERDAIESSHTIPRALAPLQQDNAESRLAQRLRDMRVALNMSSRQIAEALDIDESVLSRHLSGKRLIEPKTLKALHELLSAKEIPVDNEQNWKLLNEALSAKGPLPIHHCQAVRALEQIEVQLDETSAEIANLRAEMRATEERRQKIERELSELRAVHERLTEEQQQRLSELTLERDEAVARARFLEDRIQQMESLTRLLNMQQRAVGEVARAAEVEVARWQKEPEPAPSRTTHASTRREMEEVADQLRRLVSGNGDAFTAAQALISNYTPEQVAEVWENLQSWGQWDEARWILQRITERAPAAMIAQISKARCFKEDRSNVMLWAAGIKADEYKILAIIDELIRESRDEGVQRIVQASASRFPSVAKYRSGMKQKRSIFPRKQ